MDKATKTDLLKRIAYLEFVNDQVATELKEVDLLLRNIGFTDGLETVKAAARELMQQENEGSSDK